MNTLRKIDLKTRSLAAILFLFQRGLGGITIYALQLSYRPY
jgi:hypothetical protein